MCREQRQCQQRSVFQCMQQGLRCARGQVCAIAAHRAAPEQARLDVVCMLKPLECMRRQSAVMCAEMACCEVQSAAIAARLQKLLGMGRHVSQACHIVSITACHE